MTCPRAHCGGLLVDDDGEWVCKSCARRWTDETLELERTRHSKPAAPKATSAIEDSVLDRKLSDLLRDGDGDDEPEEETTMPERCQKPRGRGQCKADAMPGSKFCLDCGTPKPEARSPKPEARSPKRRGRPLRPAPSGGFDQAKATGNGHLLTESWMDRKTRMLAELEEAEINLAAELEKVREAKKVVGAL